MWNLTTVLQKLWVIKAAFTSLGPVEQSSETYMTDISTGMLATQTVATGMRDLPAKYYSTLLMMHT
jgi:hypothetical protein